MAHTGPHRWKLNSRNVGVCTIPNCTAIRDFGTGIFDDGQEMARFYGRRVVKRDEVCTSIHTTIFMEPKGKERPRVKIGNGRVWAYTPPNTVAAESTIRQEIMSLRSKFGAGVPLRLSVVFYRSRPKSISKSIVFPSTRPDLDQYIKLLFDACQQYIFPDDAAIVTLEAHKRFGSPPRIELYIDQECEEEVCMPRSDATKKIVRAVDSAEKLVADVKKDLTALALAVAQIKSMMKKPPDKGT